MKLEEAIELLNTAKVGWPVAGDDAEKYYEALELGIEALKDIGHCRTLGILAPEHHLPGETTD